MSLRAAFAWTQFCFKCVGLPGVAHTFDDHRNYLSGKCLLKSQFRLLSLSMSLSCYLVPTASYLELKKHCILSQKTNSYLTVTHSVPSSRRQYTNVQQASTEPSPMETCSPAGRPACLHPSHRPLQRPFKLRAKQLRYHSLYATSTKLTSLSYQ